MEMINDEARGLNKMPIIQENKDFSDCRNRIDAKHS